MNTAVSMVPGEAPAPRNQWYVIAFANEVGPEPLRREILGEPVVIYRTDAGELAALFDRCPHRGMRLSNGGKVRGETIQCQYHGMEFGPDGHCRLVPSGGAVPRALKVHSYPVHQIWEWIWIWPGDPALADVSLIPDHVELGLIDPELHAYSGLLLPIKANYLLPYENLMDATHITYLHHGVIDTGNVAGHPFETHVQGNQVSTLRVFRDEAVFPLAKSFYNLRGDVADRELTLSAYAPNVAVVQERYLEKAYPEDPYRENRLVFAVTPATTTSSYQFVTVARSFGGEADGLFEGLRNLLTEDVVAVEDIQELYDSLRPDQRVEMSVKSDEPGIRTRRMIAEMIRAEQCDTKVAAE